MSHLPIVGSMKVHRLWCWPGVELSVYGCLLFSGVLSIVGRGSVLGLRPPGFEFWVLCLKGSVISLISPSSGGFPGPILPVCAQTWPKARFISFAGVRWKYNTEFDTKRLWSEALYYFNAGQFNRSWPGIGSARGRCLLSVGSSSCSYIFTNCLYWAISIRTGVGRYPIRLILPEFVFYFGEREVLCVRNGSHFCTPVLMNMCNITFGVLRLSNVVFNKCSEKNIHDYICG